MPIFTSDVWIPPCARLCDGVTSLEADYAIPQLAKLCFFSLQVFAAQRK